MTTAGQIDVKLALNSDEFIKSFVQADDKLQELEKNLKKTKQDFENVSKVMAGTANPSKELTGLFNELKNKLKEDQSALDGFQGKLKKLQGGLVGEANPAVEMLMGSLKKLAGPAVIVAVGKKLVDLGVQATNTAAKFESLAVSFEVLTGGKEAGQELSNALIELAAKTPLTSEALTDGAKTLLSFGESADEVVGDLKLLGDITGGDAQRMQSLTLAFAQIGSTGKLAGQDLLQMINAGFNPLETISKKTGKSIGQLKDEMSKGLITFKDVKQAMIDATSEGGRYNGMMERQSQTLEGLRATNEDTWQLVSKSIGDFFLPAAKACQRAFIAIGEACLSALEKVQRFANDKAVKGATRALAPLQKSLAYQQEQLSKARTDSERKEWQERIAQTQKYIKYQQDIINSANSPKESKSTSSSGGFLAISGGGTNVTGVTGSTKSTTAKDPVVEAAKKQKDELLAISKSYQEEMAKIEDENEARNQAGGFLGSFTTGYQQRLQVIQWYYAERRKIAETANNDLIKAQEQFNQLDQLAALKNAEVNKDIWEKRGQEITSIFSKTFDTMLTNYGDFTENMQQLVLNLSRYIIKESLQMMFTSIQSGNGFGNGLNTVFNNISNSANNLVNSFLNIGQSASVAASGTAIMQGAQTVLAPIAGRVASSMMGQATQYTAAAAAAEQLAMATAKLAISQAAYSMAQIPFVGGLLAPVAAAATAAAISAGLAMVGAASLGSSVLSKAGTSIQSLGGNTESLPKFHSGGLSTQEQLAVLRKDERVLSPSESASYSNNEDGTGANGVNNIMMFNIKAWDGKDVIQTLKSNSQTINQIVNSGIKNNQQGLRSTVQNL